MSRLANSSVPPEARPRASRVIFTPDSPSRLAIKRAVPSPSRLGLVAMISSRIGPGLDACDQRVDGQLFRPDTRERRQPAQEDVINAVECAGLLEGHEIARLLDHANGRLITARVAADGADGLVGLGEMEADLAMLDSLLGGPDCVGQFECFFGGASQQVMGEPLGGLGADARETVPGR